MMNWQVIVEFLFLIFEDSIGELFKWEIGIINGVVPFNGDMVEFHGAVPYLFGFE